MEEPYGKSFDEVLAVELNAIRLRRAAAFRPPDPKSVGDGGEAKGGERLKGDGPRSDALDMDLVGLAFSGGGIRSATFALGILQGLASLRLLRRFDYLSTVSGGGYIGGWLAAWIWREGDVRNVERQLDPNRITQARAHRKMLNPLKPPLAKGLVVDEEPEPIYHLRAFSRFLTPRAGIATADTWTVLSIILRNFLVNLLLLLPATMVVVLLARLVVGFYGWGGDRFATHWGIRWYFARNCVVTIFGALALGSALWVIASERRKFGRSVKDNATFQGLREIGPWDFRWLIVAPLVGAAALCLWAFAADPAYPETFTRLPWYGRINEGLRGWGMSGSQAMVVAFGLFLVLPSFLYSLRSGSFHPWSKIPGGPSITRRPVLRGLLMTGSGCLMGALAGWLFQVVLKSFAWGRASEPVAIATFGPPLLLLIMILAGYLEIALSGHLLGEYEREWRSTIGASLLLCAAGWVALFGTTLYLPWLLEKVDRRFLSGALTWALGSTWVTASVGGVFAANSRRTGVGAEEPNPWLERLAAVGPPVFLVGLLAAVSMLTSALLDLGSPAPTGGKGDFLTSAAATPFGPIITLLCGCAFSFIVFNALLDVNSFSLHAMYENRLVRCYLGASRPKSRWVGRYTKGARSPGIGGAPTGVGDNVVQCFDRQENRVTGFDPADDLPLSKLQMPANPVGAPSPEAYRGPYPLFNTALNLVAGDDLAWQDRKAESFVLTPDYCGSRGTGYAKLSKSTVADRNLSLGRAITISGAAADPNMGWHQSAPQTALMTVFNARLGWWLEHPKAADWSAKPPHKAGGLIKELLGLTDQGGDYVHLSDGGHFENLGVYELIRRRCRYIVVCDPGEDRHDASENLANLVRLCRIDLGVNIEIDTTPIRETSADGLTRWHCAVGLIRYDEVDSHAVAGTLVFIRSSLTGDEPSDVRNYADQHPAFPHETTTLDQLFSEPQFESYRALGFHIAREVFGEAAMRLEDTPADDSAYQDDNRAFFAKVRRRWFPPPPNFEINFLEAARWAVKLEEDLRDDANLGRFSHDLYPEAENLRRPSLPVSSADGPTAPADRDRAELHAVNQMLQVMEMAWLGVHLDGYYSHPMNRGWMNAFRRWTASETFHAYWPMLRGEYSKDFVRFCETALNLDPIHVKLVRSSTIAPETRTTLCDLLNREFVREWGGELENFARRQNQPHAVGHYLNDLITMAAEPSWFSGPLGPPVWFLTNAASTQTSAHEGDWSPGDYPTGIILVRPMDRPPTTELEFFIWVRGAYRTLNIGHESLDFLFKKWRTTPEFGPGSPCHEAEHLIARYPAGGVGSADKLQRTLWMSFFHDYRFRTEEFEEDGRVHDLVLKMDLNKKKER